MHDWIVGVQRAAQTAHPGVSLEELRRAENELGEQFPSDLADLYIAMSGGDLAGDVTLFKLSEPEHGVIEKTRKKMLGLPAAGLWRFGRKGDKRHLFAARASSLREHGETGLPTWCAELPSDAWLFGTWEEDQEGVRVYRNLEHMLSVLVPPIQTEEFGESTFVRALSAVEQALLSSAPEAPEGETPVTQAPPEKISTARVGTAARKPRTPRTTGTRSGAPKTSVSAREATETANKPTRTHPMAAKAATKKSTPAKDSSVDLEALIAAEERAAKKAEKALRKAEKALRKAEKAEKKASVKGAKKAEKKASVKGAGKAEKKPSVKRAGKAEKKADRKAEKKAGKKAEKKTSAKGAKKAEKKTSAKGAKKAEKKTAVKGARKSVKTAETQTAKATKKPAPRTASKAAKAPKRTPAIAAKTPGARAAKAPAKPVSKVAKATPAKRSPAKAAASKPTTRGAGAKPTGRTAATKAPASAQRPAAKARTAAPKTRA